jgi:hypothetical protein
LQVVPTPPPQFFPGAGRIGMRANILVANGVVVNVLPTAPQLPGTPITLQYYGPAIICFRPFAAIAKTALIQKR